MYLLLQLATEFIPLSEPPCNVPGLPYNLQKKTYCVVQSTCTAISCCSDDPDMDKTFAWFINIDVCNHLLQIGIEEYKAQFSLLNFPFSKFLICRKTKEVIVTLISILMEIFNFHTVHALNTSIL